MAKIESACVFCASSAMVDTLYLDAARSLGGHLARAGLRIVYGGGATGLMGALADGAIAEGGAVVGVLPRFMDEVELGHDGVSEMRLVDDLHERVKTMKSLSDAFIALPGGCGTFDELFQSLTWKRLGLHVGPVVVVNIGGYFDPCLEMLRRAIEERFMDERHADMWVTVDSPEEVVSALGNAPMWDWRAIDFAVRGRPAASKE